MNANDAMAYAEKIGCESVKRFGIDRQIAKLGEEAGELAADASRLTGARLRATDEGRGRHGVPDNHVLGELADVLVVALSLFTRERIVEALEAKTAAMESRLRENVK